MTARHCQNGAIAMQPSQISNKDGDHDILSFHLKVSPTAAAVLTCMFLGCIDIKPSLQRIKE